MFSTTFTSLFGGLLGCLHDIEASFLQSKQSKREGRKEAMSFTTWSQRSHSVTRTLFISLELSQSVHPTLKGRGMKCHLLKRKMSKNFWTYFKTTTTQMHRDQKYNGGYQKLGWGRRRMSSLKQRMLLFNGYRVCLG